MSEKNAVLICRCCQRSDVSLITPFSNSNTTVCIPCFGKMQELADEMGVKDLNIEGELVHVLDTLSGNVMPPPGTKENFVFKVRKLIEICDHPENLSWEEIQYWIIHGPWIAENYIKND